MRLRTRSGELSVVVGDITVNACPLTASESSDLKRKHTNYMMGIPMTDNYAMSAESFSMTVKSWSPDPQDEDGKPIICTDENKRMVYNHNPTFANEILAKMDMEVHVRRRADLGNLPAGENGTSPQEKHTVPTA